MNMVPDITESGSFEITESMSSADKMTEKSIKLDFVSKATGIMKKALKVLLYALCIVLSGLYLGVMVFLLEENSIYGMAMAAIAIFVIAYIISGDEVKEVE